MSVVFEPPLVSDETQTKLPQSQWNLVWRRFRRHRLAVASAVILGLLMLASALAPLLAPFPRDTPSLQTRFVLPLTHDSAGNFRVLGTDHLGRDLFTRVLYASRLSLFIAISATLVGSILGAGVGLVAGYYGGVVDNVLMRCTELVLLFPLFLLLLLLSNVLTRNEQVIPLPPWLTEPLARALSVTPREARGVLLFILLLGVFGWPTTARMARGVALGLSVQPYVEVARGLGASSLFIMKWHLMPNALSILIIDFTLAVNVMLVTEAGLSYLSFGIQEPTPTWGNMLALAQSYMFQHPWLPLVPTLPILISSLAVNYLGDGLRDALDPRRSD